MKLFSFSRYPKGFASLFWLELLGNFSFYGVRALLVVYLTSRLFMDEQISFDLYGVFMAISFATPLLGGWLADEMYGVRKALLIGGTMVTAGFILMAPPCQPMMYFGLSVVSLGVGFFKPNIVASVGKLFPKRANGIKDSSYTLFYVGMNLGGLLGPFICGWVGSTFGWVYAFLLMALTMGWGTWICYINLKDHPDFDEKPARSDNLPSTFVTTSFCILLTLFLMSSFFYASFMAWLMPGVVIGSIIWIGRIYTTCKSGRERKNILHLSGLMFLFAIFCSLFEQSGSSITLFIQKHVDRNIMNLWTIPTPLFQSLNPFFVLFLGPLFARLWRGAFHLSSFGKFALGFAFVGLSFGILALSVSFAENGLISPIWVLGAFFIEVFGELCIVPIGFASVSKLSPERSVNRLMGLWMISISCGHYIAGLLAKLSIAPKEQDALTHYQSFFNHIMQIALMVLALIVMGAIVRIIFRASRQVLKTRVP